jgi:hypothetical protein
MPLSWNEIKSRAFAFSREWADAGNEDSEGKPFLIAFFEVFGITNKRVAAPCSPASKTPASWILSPPGTSRQPATLWGRLQPTRVTLAD